jgi:fatty-acyl-CoA synthase
VQHEDQHPATPAVADAPLTPLSFLLRSADVWAGRTAVVDGERSWTYAEHLERVRRAVGGLRARGVGPGDRVAAALPNVPAMLELHYAVPGAGGVIVPLNTRLAAAEYAYVLEHCGARLLVAWEGLREALEPALRELGDAAPDVVWARPGGGDGCAWEALLDGATPQDLALPEDERALLSVNYTSGTTGRPKGVMVTHRGSYLHSLGVIAEAGLGVRSAYLWTLPMFHCNGWAYVWAVTATGTKHVCLPQVEGGAIWRGLLQEGITHLCAAPTVIVTMVEAAEAEALPSPVSLVVGGAPPAPALIARAEELGIRITHMYGLTETYGPFAICAWNPDWDGRSEEERSRLRARQGVGTIVSERLRVVDEELRDVPRDGVSLGEVVMRGNNVTIGYYRDPEATAQAFRGGWFHSGDLGVMHPDGYVELRDRLKDVVISGGENIATIEVEQALNAHPAVSEVAVVGAPDDRWGEVPVAYVVLRGDGADPEELRAFVRERLAGFKVPKRVEVVDALPKTGTGKIQKFRLRERAAG